MKKLLINDLPEEEDTLVVKRESLVNLTTSEGGAVRRHDKRLIGWVSKITHADKEYNCVRLSSGYDWELALDHNGDTILIPIKKF